MRALALFSGGLDSMLAIKAVVDQGVEVIAIHIKTGFGGTKDITALMRERAERAGAKLEVVDVREAYIQKILFDPVYGYGKNFNPCIDCHGYMFKVAKGLMSQYDASFLITGEVVGQRPMSQRVDAMKQVSKLADDWEDKLILRPMSAKLMEITAPEEKGWVDREKLHAISGRSREPQLTLAEAYGWEDYESPGGGCLLTEEHFSERLREFVAHDKLEVSDVDLLKYGRHFRLPDGAKLIVGRNQEDNEGLQAIKSEKYITVKLPVAGPFSLLSADATEQDRVLAARIAITYARSSAKEQYAIEMKGDEVWSVSPFASKKEAQRYFFNAATMKEN
ncbi:MAG TPA: ATP-binding protein [Epsilonproteobacteria bacterium]|nr:ATP-binding protein [Campylobacterota bacterium]